jgi:hypothetical protein
MSRSTTPGHLSYIALEPRRAETTTSVSLLQAHLQAAAVEQFRANHDIVEHSAYQVKDKDPQQCPRSQLIRSMLLCPFAKLHAYRTTVRKQMCAPRVVV